MTEKWKSNPMFWCDLCKVWMQDNPTAKQTHERGIKHQEALKMKLRDMRKTSARKQSEEKRTEATLKELELRAKHQYEEDLKDAHAVEATTRGRWEEDEKSGLLYHPLHRYYYSRDTGMYYGGDPPAWTHTPSMPPEARWKEQEAAGAGPSSAAEQAQPAFTRRPAAAGQGARTLTIKAHPQAGIGGVRLPQHGVLGALKGVGSLSSGEAGPAAGSSGAKRKADGPAGGGGGRGRGKPVSAEEAAALQRREEARKRVEARTLAGFGMAAR